MTFSLVKTIVVFYVHVTNIVKETFLLVELLVRKRLVSLHALR